MKLFRIQDVFGGHRRVCFSFCISSSAVFIINILQKVKVHQWRQHGGGAVLRDTTSTSRHERFCFTFKLDKKMFGGGYYFYKVFFVKQF